MTRAVLSQSLNNRDKCFQAADMVEKNSFFLLILPWVWKEWRVSFESIIDISHRNHLLHQNSFKMKRYTAFATAILLVGFTLESCKKESFSGVEKFESLLSLPSSAEMRIAFTEMTSSEKLNFWKYNLRKNMDGLSVIQKKLVSEIYEQFSPAAYENGSNDNVRLKTLIIPNWLAKAETMFSKDKMWELFYFMEGEKIVRASPDSYVLEQVPESELYFYSESAPNCLCNIGSSYTCKKKEISVGTDSGIKVTYGSCSYSKNNGICDRDSYGCGFALMWACNGNTCTF